MSDSDSSKFIVVAAVDLDPGSTLVLERASGGGGTSAMSGGVLYLGGGTALQKACGFEDSPDEMFKYLMASVGRSPDEQKIREYCDGSVEHYAWIGKLCANQGVTDEAGMKAVAEQNGINGDQFLRGSQGWAERMGKSMAVGQRFRQHYDQY